MVAAIFSNANDFDASVERAIDKLRSETLPPQPDAESNHTKLGHKNYLESSAPALAWVTLCLAENQALYLLLLFASELRSTSQVTWKTS